MKRSLLLLALICTLVPAGFARAAPSSCTEISLHTVYQQKQKKGLDTTNLIKKSWWTRCPLAVRKAVYASLFQSSASSSASFQSATVKSLLPILRKAPEFAGLGTWFQSEPLTIASLRGKVTLIHFWTYTCINCVHTLPTVQGYWEKFKTQPFMLVGVHTPEFTFEKSEKNVAKALKEHGLTYPVVQDNDFATWNAFGNRYWPAFYMIDKQGNIRYEHFGEGEYETMDKVIQELLQEAGG
ncbi:redoxin domain-containing protein [Candidatus Peribacteria bacterium]|nr:redoxin domain-containing protein [Candidatus Peribacteria bacterium]